MQNLQQLLSPREARIRYVTVAGFLAVVLIYGVFLAFFSSLGGDFDDFVASFARIITNPSILINDYMLIAGPGVALINASILGFCMLAILYFAGSDFTGPAIAGVFVAVGFGLFGKNLYNVWPMIFGVWLYGRCKGIGFRDHLLIALSSATLAPLVSSLSFPAEGCTIFSVIIGVAAGVTAGFFLPPLAKRFLVIHQGYNIFNMGFTCGFVGILANAALVAFGVRASDSFYWGIGGKDTFFVPLLCFFCAMMFVGFLFDSSPKENLKDIYASTGRLVSDYVVCDGFGASLINMGSIGLFGMCYLILVRGDFNGPTIGALFAISGFGAFGAHLFNVIPTALGVWMAATFSVWSVSSPGAVLSGLFCVTLSPIAGAYGYLPGFAAGFLHLVTVMSVINIQGGLNLYNNGFSGGIVAMMMLPVLETLFKED